MADFGKLADALNSIGIETDMDGSGLFVWLDDAHTMSFRVADDMGWFIWNRYDYDFANDRWVLVRGYEDFAKDVRSAVNKISWWFQITPRGANGNDPMKL